MLGSDWKKRKEAWKRFEQWEKLAERPKASKEILSQVGEWTDFFLSRHPQALRVINSEGIVKMHRLLSVLPTS